MCQAWGWGGRSWGEQSRINKLDRSSGCSLSCDLSIRSLQMLTHVPKACSSSSFAPPPGTTCAHCSHCSLPAVKQLTYWHTAALLYSDTHHTHTDTNTHTHMQPPRAHTRVHLCQKRSAGGTPPRTFSPQSAGSFTRTDHRSACRRQ